MDKREFLKTSGMFLAGTVLTPLGSGEQAPGKRTNWSGNYTFSTDRLHQPKTVEEVQQVVKGCSKLRALGARHSFNGIADSTQDQVSLAHLNQMVLHRESRTVTVGGGLPTANWPPIWKARVMHCTTWHPCRRFPSPAPLLQRPTVQATRTEIWLRLYLRWKW
jgi:xylitol oxidase